MNSMSTWILSIKVLLISAGVVSIAMGLKFSVPIAMNGIPAIWSVVLSWMKPPYLYILINGIIISIAASSRFHKSQSEPSVRSEHLISVKTPPPSDFAPASAHREISTTVMEETSPTEVVVFESDLDLKHVVVNGTEVAEEFEDEGEADDVFIDPASTYGIPSPEMAIAKAEAEDMFVDSTAVYDITEPPPEITFPELQLESDLLSMREKPLVSSRFGHRKPIRTSPEGVKALRRVSRPKRQETLESTWKTITEGRHVPLTRHIKKSDTWEQHVRHATPALDLVPKSETFKDRTINNYESNSPPPSSRIRKEPSLSQDELNRRVEAFIKKFNEEMRLQRQESLNQYMEMINRGV